MALRQNMGYSDMPMTQVDLSEQGELESIHQLNKARENKRRRVKKIRGKSTEQYLGCRTQVTSSVGHRVSPAVWDTECLHRISCVLV